MKRLISISILIIITLNSIASPVGEYVIKTVILGTATTALCWAGWHEDPQVNGYYLSLGFDPDMVMEQYIPDIRGQIYRKKGPVALGMIYEHVPDPIYYDAISLSLDIYVRNKRTGIFIGPEVTRIWNDNGNAWSIGMNAGYRYRVWKGLNLSMVGNIKTRPEISAKYRFNFYFMLESRIWKL